MARIPHSEYTFEFSRSGGAGGQNVNKVSSRVTLRWSVRESRSLNNSQKRRIESSDALSTRLNSAGEVVIHEQRSRNQADNRRLAAEKLEELIAAALKRRKPRKFSGTPRSQKELRLHAKKRRSEKLRERKSRSD